MGDFKPTTKLTKKGKPRPLSKKQQNQSYLDAIADYCTEAAVVPTFVGYRLYLAPARTLDQIEAQGVERMVLGQNIEDLELGHKMTKAHARAIEVRSFNPDTGQMAAARYPEDPNVYGPMPPGQVNNVAPSGPVFLPPGAAAVDEHAVEIQTVYGVTDPKRLRAIAENVWEERARQDVEGRFTTKDIATIEGRAKGVADLLSLRAGDPISIVIAPSVEEEQGSYIQRIASMSLADATAMLKKTGWREQVAERVARSIILSRRPLIFRVREIDFEWSNDAATKTEVSFINYIEVIDDEFRAATKGGNVAGLPANASFAQTWQAIELDYYAGQLSLEQKLDMQAKAASKSLEPQAAA